MIKHILRLFLYLFCRRTTSYIRLFSCPSPLTASPCNLKVVGRSCEWGGARRQKRVKEKSHLEAERRTTSAGWHRDGAEEKARGYTSTFIRTFHRFLSVQLLKEKTCPSFSLLAGDVTPKTHSAVKKRNSQISYYLCKQLHENRFDIFQT